MAQLLVINPNTSRSVTGIIDALARDEAGAAHAVETVTARFGFPYIASHTAFAIAGHAVLEAAVEAMEKGARPDAIVLGCFGDPGIDALEELTGLPTVGFAEAGLWEAAAESGAFIVATRGAIWRDMLQDIVRRLGLADRVAAVHCVEEEEPAAIAALLSSLAKDTGAEPRGAGRRRPHPDHARSRARLGDTDPRSAPRRDPQGAAPGFDGAAPGGRRRVAWRHRGPFAGPRRALSDRVRSRAAGHCRQFARATGRRPAVFGRRLIHFQAFILTFTMGVFRQSQAESYFSCLSAADTARGMGRPRASLAAVVQL